MQPMFKTWKKATYFKGLFELRNHNENWAIPIQFPCVFNAYGPTIKSGNWQSTTAINTPNYVINNYFDTVGHSKNDAMFKLWEYCKQLEGISWADVHEDISNVINLIELANKELKKLDTL